MRRERPVPVGDDVIERRGGDRVIALDLEGRMPAAIWLYCSKTGRSRFAETNDYDTTPLIRAAANLGSLCSK